MRSDRCGWHRRNRDRVSLFCTANIYRSGKSYPQQCRNFKTLGSRIKSGATDKTESRSIVCEKIIVTQPPEAGMAEGGFFRRSPHARVYVVSSFSGLPAVRALSIAALFASWIMSINFSN